MRAVDIIAKKRDGLELTEDEIRFFCDAAVNGPIKDYQVSALLMAIYLRGMTVKETAALTLAMAASGDQIDLSSLRGVAVDKHSTGGVGDTTTLVLAPLAAACGASVAKLSGRGLGHTGGTLDKLESIPRLTTHLTREQFIEQVERIGIAVVSQTPTLVPADKLFYTLRDVTATVDSIPLIASSVMSKKIAAGARVILLDVKLGQGAFMKSVESARELAHAMVDIGRLVKRRVAAIISDMDAPLGNYIGNALEVREAIEILRGEHADSPLREVSLAMVGHLLHLADLAKSHADGLRKAEQALSSGQGLHKLRQMIEAQNGDALVVDDLERLPQAREVVPLKATRGGWIDAIDALRVGDAAMRLGAGRMRKEDTIDPAVGIILKVRRGARVRKGDVVAELHVNDRSSLDRATALLHEAITFSDAEPSKGPPLIREAILE